MKRILPLAAIGIAVLAALIWLAFGRDEGPEPWLGYVEGESIEVAAPVSGQLASLNVQRGGQVAAGQALFALNAATTEAARRGDAIDVALEPGRKPSGHKDPRADVQAISSRDNWRPVLPPSESVSGVG